MKKKINGEEEMGDVIVSKSSDRSMKVFLPVLLGNYDKLTDRPGERVFSRPYKVYILVMRSHSAGVPGRHV